MDAAKYTLTPKEDRFVDEYLVDLNGTAAYKRTRPSVSDNTARTEAYKLLSRPQIQEAIASRKAARAARTQVTYDRVVRELARIAFLSLKLGPKVMGPKVRALTVLLEHTKTTGSDGKDLAESFADLVAEAQEWEKKGGEE